METSFQLHNLTLLVTPSATQQKAINQLLAQQQDPTSANYHKWLTPEQYGARFGLSPNDIQKIKNWLKAEGFTNIGVARSSNLITFSGTVAQVERTFQTQMHKYDVNGKMMFSSTAAPKIPAALAGVVTGMRGLNNYHLAPAFRRPQRQYYDSNSGSQLLAPADLSTIYDLGSLATSGIDGTGQALAIIGQTDIYQADLTDFRAGFNLPAITGCTSDPTSGVITSCNTANFAYILSGGTDPLAVDSIGDDLPEADLDLEWSGATAPGAQIIYVNAPDPNGNGVVDSMSYAITNNVAPVVSMSYGLCELFTADNAAGGFAIFTESEFQQANLQGMTIVNSSGDNGAAGCDYFSVTGTTTAVVGYQVSSPASFGEVTAVGGTSIPVVNPNEYGSQYWNQTGNVGGSALTYIPEQTWDEPEEFGAFCVANPQNGFCTGTQITSWSTAQQVFGISGGGGGVSNCFNIDNNGVCVSGIAQPSFQAGLSASAINPNGVGVTSSPARYVPDVSLLASPDFPGYIICTAEFELGGNGTASACANGILQAVAGCSMQGGTCPIIGGTSAAAPAFAGMLTVLNQYLVQNGLQANPGLSNANPALYQMAVYDPTAFHPITTSSSGNYSNGAWCQAGQPTSGIQNDPWPPALQCPSTGQAFLGFNTYNSDPTTNYNLVTGLGSVDVGNLATAWGNLLTPLTTFTITPSATQVSHGQNVTFTVAVQPTTAAGTLTFYTDQSGTALGTATLSNGSAQFSTTALPLGTNNVTAAYVGTNQSETTPTPATVVVSAPDFQFGGSVPDPPSANAGQTTTTSMTIAAVGSGTFDSSVTYSCSGLPTGATCSFNPASGSLGSGSPSPATIQITVNTAGPFTGQAGSVVHRNSKRTSNEKPRLWLPLTLPLFGILFFGLSGSGARRRYAIAGLCLTLLFAGFLVACGGGSHPPAPVTISVSPSAANTLYPNLQGAPAQTQQFTATVSNTSNTAVTWAISHGGTDDSISSTGLYTAPSSVPQGPVTITATSQADSSKTANATVNILTPTPSGTYQIMVTVTEGTVNHSTSFNLTVN